MGGLPIIKSMLGLPEGDGDDKLELSSRSVTHRVDSSLHPSVSLPLANLDLFFSDSVILWQSYSFSSIVQFFIQSLHLSQIQKENATIYHYILYLPLF